MNLINIKKSYNSKKVLENVTLDIEEREFLVILGNSGSGKSTLLKIIAGIENADAGEIFQNGEKINELPIQKRDIGYIFQEPLLFPHMTVKQNIAYSLLMAKKSKAEIEQKCKEYMQLLQIGDLGDRMPHEISGGQKQRVSIARAIINSPKMLLMDEPFSSLDMNLRMQMGEMMQNLKKKLGLTIIFVTHDISESMLLGDRIAFLNEGKLIEVNSPQEMYYSPIFEETAKFMGEYNVIYGEKVRNKLETKYGVFDVSKEILDRKKMFVRPNKIQLLPHENGQFTIDKIILSGKETRITLKDEPLIIDTYFSENLKTGDRVNLHFEVGNIDKKNI